MANKNILSRIQHKHDTQANWEKAVNFIPLEGEIIIYDADDNYSYSRIKIGDGKTAVNALPFSSEKIYKQNEAPEDVPDGSLWIDTDAKGESFNSKNYYTKEEVSNLIDEAIDAIPTPDVSGQINSHNSSANAHTDIRNLINNINIPVQSVNGKTGALSLNASDVGAAPSSHNHDNLYYTETEVDTKLASKSDKTHNHNSDYDAKGAAAAVQENLNATNNTVSSHTGNTDIHVTTTNKSNWNAAYTHSTSTHARTDATKVADSTTNGNILINGTETTVYSHPNSGVTAGTYKSVTVNAQGHITGGSNPTTLSGYGITDAESKGAASSALASAKTYADSAATTAANKVKNDLLNGAGAAYDTLKELGDLINDNQDAIEALETVASNKADKSHNHTASDITSGTLASARLPAATSSALGGVKIGSNINVSSGTISVPAADGSTAGVTVVYPAASCTTYSSDSGTVTPLAVQKGAKMFAITRPASSTNKAITRYSNTTGDVQDSKIIIEDVTNTRDSSKKAQVIAIPAEGGKKMVYGYCTDQVDGTSFIGGVFDANATEYPYTAGLAIGGTSGNLLYKGNNVLNASNYTEYAATKGHTHSAATTSAAGLMSAADKAKLDGLTSGGSGGKVTIKTWTASDMS